MPLLSENEVAILERGNDLYESDLSDDENPGSDDDGDNTFKLSEEGDAFIEAAFKTRMDDTTRTKKKVKLELPDCKWLKPPQLDSFIASTIPKGVVRVVAAAQETHKLWLEATAPLTAIIKKVDAGDIDQAEAIQGIRAALVLLGNASQH